MLRGCGFINGDVFMHPSAYSGPGDPAAWFASLQVGDEVEFVAKFHMEGRNNWRVVRVRDVPDAMLIQRRRRVLASCPEMETETYPNLYQPNSRWTSRAMSAQPDQYHGSHNSHHLHPQQHQPHNQQQQPNRPLTRPMLRDFQRFDPRGRLGYPDWDHSAVEKELRMASDMAAMGHPPGLERGSTYSSLTSTHSPMYSQHATTMSTKSSAESVPMDYSYNHFNEEFTGFTLPPPTSQFPRKYESPLPGVECHTKDEFELISNMADLSFLDHPHG
jgi:hypothetical protein